MRVYPALSSAEKYRRERKGGVYAAALKRRSVRRFKKKRIPVNILERLVNAARLAPSAANLQPCEFIVVDKRKLNKLIFPALRWAGYIYPKGNPSSGKEPCAYIIVLINKRKKPLFAEADAACAVENILLVAQDEGLGSCWLGAIERERIRKILKVPAYCEIKYVIALGYPDEQPKVERLKESVRYWQDKQGCLHVPKRSLKEVLHRNTYRFESRE